MIRLGLRNPGEKQKLYSLLSKKETSLVMVTIPIHQHTNTSLLNNRSTAGVPFNSVRRFRASLLLHTTCDHSYCTTTGLECQLCGGITTKKIKQIWVCVAHPCCVFMEVCFVQFLCYLSTCVCVCLQVQGPLQECPRAGLPYYCTNRMSTIHTCCVFMTVCFVLFLFCLPICVCV